MSWDEVLLTLLAWLGLSAAGGIACLAIWLVFRPAKGGLLPRRPQKPAFWSGLVVLLVFLLFLLWQPACLAALLVLAGHTDPSKEVMSAFAAPASALAFPFQLGSILLVLRRLAGARSHDIGLHTSRLGGNLILAYLGFVVLTPLVYAVDFLATWSYLEATGQLPKPHQLIQVIQDRDRILDWLLLWLLAVVVAPVIEELVFRGVLQPWLLARPHRSHVIMAVSVALPALLFPTDRQAVGLFVLATFPVYLLLPLLLRNRASKPAEPEATGEKGSPSLTLSEPTAENGTLPGRIWNWLVALNRAGEEPAAGRGWAIYATAVLFAEVHPWPTPVPLLFLGLGLGLLAWRTRSLVGPIVLHALFNSVGCLTLMLQY
jgi:membrane protease YdiL (CAAX protease family)